MIILDVLHKMKWLDTNGNESEQVKIYGIFGLLITNANTQEQYIQEIDRQLANLTERIKVLEKNKNEK